MFKRIELIETPSIDLDATVRIILFPRRGSHGRADGGVAAEGPSCMIGTNQKYLSENASDPYRKALASL